MAQPRAKWTVLTYIAAHNNLDSFGQQSLNQILGVGSTGEVKLAVLYDGTAKAARYIAGEPGKAAMEEPLSSFDSGDGDALLKTVRWAFEQYPADRYGLILWSHGSGWRPEEIEEVAKQARGDAQVDAKESAERATAPGSMAFFRSTLKTILKQEKPAERAVCFDDGTGHSLDTLELERVANEIQALIGQPLDLLGMDACLMANLEVAYQLRNLVGCLVASQELVPGFSWPYDTILSELCHKPDCSASELAVSVVQHYADFYRINPPAVGDVTKVALDLSNLDSLVKSIDDLAKAVLADIDHQADRLWAAQLGTYQQEARQGKRDPNKFRFHLWDINSLAARLASSSSNEAIGEAAQAVMTALKSQGRIVLAEAHQGDWFEGIGGVSIYLVPPKKQRISPYYAEVALAKETKWLEMLMAYHNYYA